MTPVSLHATRTALGNSHLLCLPLMVAVGLAVLWCAISLGGQPFTPDSANYIEQARSLLAGNGFVSVPYGTHDIDIVTAPDKLFPPGYPLLIGAGSAISGVAVEMVAPWISRIALMILPLTVYLAFRSVIGSYGAVSLGALVGFSPGIVNWGYLALTDVLSLTFVVISLGITMAAWPTPKLRQALLIACGGGAVAGFAYLTRNANIALLLAVSLSMAVWFFLSPLVDKGRTLKIGLSWAFGAAIVVLPWLARNVIVFGKVKPYDMAPSTIGAWDNLRFFISAQTSEILGSPHFGVLIGWSVPGFLALLLVTGVVVYLACTRWEKLGPGERRAFIFALVYAFCGAAVVIAARTKYAWGEVISERHTLQYAPFVLLPAIILLRHISSSKAATIAVSATILLGLTTLRYSTLTSEALSKRPDIDLELVRKYAVGGMMACPGDDKLVVLSNYSYLYRILCNANARFPDLGGQTISELIASNQRMVGQRPMIVAFHPGRGIDPSAIPVGLRDIETLTGQGWMIRENSPLSFVLAHDGQ